MRERNKAAASACSGRDQTDRNAFAIVQALATPDRAIMSGGGRLALNAGYRKIPNLAVFT
jgi:hypothetical protein